MVVEAYERAARRLREHQRKCDAAVGTRIGGVSLALWRVWDEVAGGFVRVLEIVPPALWLDRCRRLAQAVLGPDVAAALEIPDPEHGRVLYLLAIDPIDLSRLDVYTLRRPAWIRWFDGRILGTGLGQDPGRVTFAGWAFERPEDT